MISPDPTDNPPPGVLAYLNERLRRDDAGAPYFADDAGHPHIDISLPGCPNASARAVAAWTRECRPELWGSDNPEAETKPPNAPTTVSAVMAAVREGRMTLDQAYAAMPAVLNPHAGTAPMSKPATPTTTVTQAMIRARSGDAAAIDYLTNYTKNHR